MNQVNFETLIGHEVILFSSALNPGATPETVTVRGVDAGGIWIESQVLTDLMLKGIGKTMFEGTPITYVPFWRIVLAASGIDIPAISSEGIGK